MQGLPIVDDGNSHDFFCALRLVVDNQPTDQQKLFPQSARTKCVKPALSKINNLNEGKAEWNELFIFEVPRKVSENLLSSIFDALFPQKATINYVTGFLDFLHTMQYYICIARIIRKITRTNYKNSY